MPHRSEGVDTWRISGLNRRISDRARIRGGGVRPQNEATVAVALMGLVLVLV